MEANFRQERLFRSAGHPEFRLLRHLAVTLFRQMGADSTVLSLIETRLTPTNMPVQPDFAPLHPSVIEHFSLSFVTKETKYRLWDDEITFEDYVRRYLTLDWDTNLDQALELGRQVSAELAIPAMIDALRSRPLAGRGHAALAELLWRSSNVDGALDAISRAVAAEPDNAHHHFTRSRIFVTAQNPEAAARAAKRSTELDPSNDTYYHNVSEILSIGDDRQGMIEALRNAVQLAPLWTPHRHQLGQLLGKCGDITESEECQAELDALELGPLYGLMPNS